MAPDMIAPPSAPMLAQMPTPGLQTTEPDDIPDPPVPASARDAVQAPANPVGVPNAPQAPQMPSDTFNAHEALLQGFCQHLQNRLTQFLVEESKGLLRAFESTTLTLRECLERVAQPNEHAQYQLSDALLKLQEHGIALKGDPYRASLEALTPQGFPVTITVAKQQAGELVEALPALVGWMVEQGYKPA